MLAIALVMLATLASAADRRPSGCGPGFVWMYDELHSFGVDSPPGWCGAEGEEGVFRSASKESLPEIRVWFTYSTAASRSTPADPVASALDSIARGAASQLMQPIRTSGGETVKLWSLAAKDGAQKLVGLLPYENGIVLVRFVLTTAAGALTPDAEHAFRLAVQSFRGNARRRPTKG